MTNKEMYEMFCKNTYVPIYSKAWWMDAVCGPEHWDVWLYKTDTGTQSIEAAMPYYMERRGAYRYITKAPLTQSNGIVFRRCCTRKRVAQAQMEERVIEAACKFIESLNLDVYEQQFHYSFQNWQPFFWNNFTNNLRYTYVIEDTSDLSKVMKGISANYRNTIRKGQRSVQIFTDISEEDFYTEHEKIFHRQGLDSPFSKEFWSRLYHACVKYQSGQLLCARDSKDHIHALLFLVWDEESVYHLLGGPIPEFASSQAYSALTYHGIEIAHEKGLAYDFEGSMIRRIAVSFREYGGIPVPYYRIRKVFNPEIVRKEAENYIQVLSEEKGSRI